MSEQDKEAAELVKQLDEIAVKYDDFNNFGLQCNGPAYYEMVALVVARLAEYEEIADKLREQVDDEQRAVRKLKHDLAAAEQRCKALEAALSTMHEGCCITPADRGMFGKGHFIAGLEAAKKAIEYWNTGGRFHWEGYDEEAYEAIDALIAVERAKREEMVPND